MIKQIAYWTLLIIFSLIFFLVSFTGVRLATWLLDCAAVANPSVLRYGVTAALYAVGGYLYFLKSTRLAQSASNAVITVLFLLAVSIYAILLLVQPFKMLVLVYFVATLAGMVIAWLPKKSLEIGKA